MKKILQTSAILFLALMLVMATGGFSIYHHFCHCAGKETSSFFIKTTCEHEKAAVKAASCCKKELPACCKDKAPVKHEKSGKRDKCCNTSLTFLKISDNFTVSLGKISMKFVVNFNRMLTGVTLQTEPQEVTFKIPDFNDTSPPIFGTDLLHQLHQLKIAHLLV